MKVQADLQLSDEAFAMRAGMSVAELREILHGDRELLLGSYVQLAAAVETPLGSLLLEAEKLAQTLAVRAVT